MPGHVEWVSGIAPWEDLVTELTKGPLCVHVRCEGHKTKTHGLAVLPRLQLDTRHCAVLLKKVPHPALVHGLWEIFHVQEQVVGGGLATT